MEKGQIMKKNNQSGFTLLEVLVATGIFAFFATSYVISQGGSLSDSSQMREETLLQDLALNTINEIIHNPPELREALTLTPTKKSYEDFPEYEYEIEWKQFEVPDIASLKGDQQQQGENGNGQQAALQQQIGEKIKENMEKLLWQVKVTSRNKKTGFAFSLSSWILNQKAQVEFNGF